VSLNLLNLAAKLFDLGQYADCEEVLRHYLVENDMDLAGRVLLSRCYLEMGRIDLARDQIDVAQRLAVLKKASAPELDELHAQLIRPAQETPEPGTADPGPAQMETTAAQAPTAPPRSAAQPAPQETIRATRGFSPYFGFPIQAYQAGGNNYGFENPQFPDNVDYPYERDENEFIVGVFGGSVAAGFAKDMALRLREALARHPDLKGQKVTVLNFAMGSVKQPIQLFYLSYFLAIGQKLDLVVNLDGFNDTFGAISNLIWAHHPAMPPSQLTTSLEALVNVPKLDETYLRYFLSLAKTNRRIERVARGPLAFLKPLGILKQLEKRRDWLREHHPDSPEKVSLMQVSPAPKLDFLNATADQRDQTIREVVDIWRQCTSMMADICRGQGISFLFAIQPNQHYSKKPLTGEEDDMVYSGKNPRAPLIVSHAYPVMLDAARELAAQGILFCPMTDVFDSIHEQVFLDGICHFNSRGHELMADRLVEHVFHHEESLLTNAAIEIVSDD